MRNNNLCKLFMFLVLIMEKITDSKIAGYKKVVESLISNEFKMGKFCVEDLRKISSGSSKNSTLDKSE